MDEEYDLPQPEELGLPAPQNRPPQQEQFQPPGAVEPFSQSDDLQLQRLQAGLATVRQQVWDGDLHEQEGQAYQQRIVQQAAPLAARKKQSQQLERQNQLEEALHVSAMQKAVEQQNAAFDANGFSSRASYLRNPQTGQMAMFYQKEPGKFEPVDFGESGDPYQSSADGQGGVYVAGQDDAADNENGEPPDSEGAEGTRDAAIPPDAAPQLQAEIPATGTAKPGPLTVVNGNERSVYENGRLTEHTTLDGTPIQGPGKEGDKRFGLNKETLDYIHHIATVGSMHLPPGVQRNAMYSHLYQRGVMQAVQEAAVQKREQIQIAKEERKAAVVAKQKEEDDHEKEWVAGRDKNQTKLENEWAKANPNETMPDDVRDALSEKAASLADKQHMQVRGKLPKFRDGQGSQGNQESQAGGEQPALKTFLGNKGATVKQYTDMQGKALDEVKSDKGMTPGMVLNPADGGYYGGPWAKAPPEVQKAEADRRVAEKVQGLTGKPVAGTKHNTMPADPSANPGAPPSQQGGRGGGPAPVQLPADQSARLKDVLQKHGTGPGAKPVEAPKATTEQDPWWIRMFDQGIR